MNHRTFKISFNISLDPRTTDLVFRLPLLQVLTHPGAGPYGFSVGRWEVSVLSYTDLKKFDGLTPPDKLTALGSCLSIFNNQLEGTVGACPLATIDASQLKKYTTVSWEGTQFFPLRQGLDGDLLFDLASADFQSLLQTKEFDRSSLMLVVCLRKME